MTIREKTRFQEKVVMDRLEANMLQKFIKLYTPFICAIIASIHGVLFLLEIESNIFLRILSNITGHSLLLLYFVLIHSKRMCKWYKRSIYMLIYVHVINIAYYLIDEIPIWTVLYGGLVLNIASMMCWVVFIAMRTIFKTVCSTHTDLEEQE